MNSNVLSVLKRLENQGRLKPEDVVNEAKKPSSPLHDYFEWDDEKAANEHRLEQARQLIRSVRVVISEQNVEVRVPAYVRDPSLPQNVTGYVRITALKKEPDLAIEAAIRELKTAESNLERAKSIAVALGAFESYVVARKALQETRMKMEELAA